MAGRVCAINNGEGAGAVIGGAGWACNAAFYLIHTLQHSSLKLVCQVPLEGLSKTLAKLRDIPRSVVPCLCCMQGEMLLSLILYAAMDILEAGALGPDLWLR